jgi:hypothetical protein
MTRSADAPIGRIARSGYGVSRAAGAIHWYVLSEGPQAVFVADDGRVRCAPVGTSIERLLAERYPEWFCGCYSYRAATELTRADIAADLRARACELYGVAA